MFTVLVGGSLPIISHQLCVIVKVVEVLVEISSPSLSRQAIPFDLATQPFAREVRQIEN
jgi:hypothetical protein